MKRYITLTLLIFSIYCKAQTEFKFDYINFENKFLYYEPVQSQNTTQKDFDYAAMIIRETKASIKNNPENFNRADYFNVLSAFLTLKESKENIKIAFEKFKDTEGSCEYFISFEKSVEKNAKYDIIREDYNKELAKCKANPVIEEVFDISEYCKTNNLDLALIEKIHKIHIDDQKYRNTSSNEYQAKQPQLDKKNQEIIDSLFNVYKSYLGRTLVGEKFESVMWAVIQHSYPDLERMERYLPIIHKAVIDKELNVVPFKMLLDRYYGLKYGYQIFGSQSSGLGFKLADDKKRKEIELKYGIE